MPSACASLDDADRAGRAAGRCAASSAAVDARQDARRLPIGAHARCRFRRKAAIACIACSSRICARRRIRRTVFAAWRRLPRDVRRDADDHRRRARSGARARGARRSLRPIRACSGWGHAPHAWTRQAIKRAHLLIVSSRMEGGANVVVEAVTAGTAGDREPHVGQRRHAGRRLSRLFRGRRARGLACARRARIARSRVPRRARSGIAARERARVRAGGRSERRSRQQSSARRARATGRMTQSDPAGSTSP